MPVAMPTGAYYMTILESFAQIPLMFYISLLFLPVSIYGYLTFGKPKKKIVAAAANPADQLKKKALDVKRETTSAIFLGATIAFSVSLVVSMGILVGDYKNSHNLFAETKPAATLPPAMNNVFPPAPTGN
jgi:hypothetical protein